MVDFYFAGTQTSPSEKVILDLNANVLKSYVNEKTHIQRWANLKKEGKWHGKLLVDSGAFTAHKKDVVLDTDTYISWINEIDEYVDYFIQIDHIPGKFGKPRTMEQVLEAPKKTYENYTYMLARVKSPEKLLPVFHMGESFDNLTRILHTKVHDSYVPYICISGMKDRTAKERKVWYAKCMKVIKESNNPNVKTHCLGSATFSDHEQFGFTSMDATTWIMTSANGNILTDYGNITVSEKNNTSENISIKCGLSTEILNECCSKYGVTLEEVRTDYTKRSEVNIKWIHEKSLKSEYNPSKILRGRLL